MILHIAEKRRRKLNNELRDSKEAIGNGSSFIAEGKVLIDTLRSIS